MTTKDELHRVVDTLSEQGAADVLDYAQWLLEGPETLTGDAMARVKHGDEQVARGEFVTLDDVYRRFS